MLGYLIRRILATIPVIGMVAFFVFSLLYLTPGDPAAVIAGDIATNEDIERIRQKLGLDQPFLTRFGTWAWGVLQGDLGISIFTNLPVTQLIGQRVEPTLSLAICTLIVAVLVAVPLGVIGAWKAGKFIDRLVMLFSVLGFSIPVFVFAYVLIYVFAIQLDWLPVQGYTPIREGFWPWLRQLILPSIALGTIYIALIARITRATMLDVLAQDYVRTAHAKGLAPNAVLMQHALKNAAVPIVTIIRPLATGCGLRMPSPSSTCSNRRAGPPPGLFMQRSAISATSRRARTGWVTRTSSPSLSMALMKSRRLSRAMGLRVEIRVPGFLGVILSGAKGACLEACLLRFAQDDSRVRGECTPPTRVPTCSAQTPPRNRR